MSARAVLARGALALLGVGLALVIAELSFRALRERFGFTEQELGGRQRAALDQGRFVPHPFLGYTREPEAYDTPFPFADEPFPREKTPGVLRVACLGGSTTADGYPALLAGILREESGRDVQMMNWGVPAWTSAETLANWFQYARAWSPDVVVVHHAINDVRPRQVTGFRADYAHYRRPWATSDASPLERMLARRSELWLASNAPVATIAGRTEKPAPLAPLVPETTAPFVRNLTVLAEDVVRGGARPLFVTMPLDPTLANHALHEELIAGAREHNALVRALAQARGWALADLAARQESEPAALAGRFDDVVHLDVEGRRTKARWIGAALLEAGLLDG